MKSSNNLGFAAILLVISLSVSLMTAMVAVGDSTWLLKQNVLSLGDRTQRQLAADGCRQLALLYIAEDPEFSVSAASSHILDLGKGITCSILSVSRASGSFSPYADRIIETKGEYKGIPAVMVGRVGVTNTGLVEKEKYFK